MLLATHTPVLAYSDCSSAIRRASQALSPLDTAVGHLQHGSLLLGIRQLAHLRCPHTSLTWTQSHPEWRLSESSWTDNDRGIHMADAIAGDAEPNTALRTYLCDADQVHNTITPPSTWRWHIGDSPFHSSIRKRAQRHQFLLYRKQRDMKRIYANAPSRWTRYCPSLMALLTKVRRPTPRQKGRRTKHLFDWMAHAANLAKGYPVHLQHDHSHCSFCGKPETQSHINAFCSHPPLVEARRMVKQRIDEVFMTYRHTSISPDQRWIAPLMDHMEDHMWKETEEGGDIWNGRWTRSKLDELIPDASTYIITQQAYKTAIVWVQRLTEALQWAQRTLYRIRHVELRSKEAHARHAAVITLRRRRKTRRIHNLFAAWKLPYYFKPVLPRRKWKLPPQSPPQHLKLIVSVRSAPPLAKWLQYAKAFPSTTTPPPSQATQRRRHTKR